MREREKDIIRIDEHHEALKIFYEKEIVDAVIFHVDFHIDIGYVEDEKCLNDYECLKTCNSIYEISELPWHMNIDKEGLHCGNYIYYAMKYGMISKYIWIMPDEERPFYEVASRVLQELGGISEEEYKNIKVGNGFIQGKIYGVDFLITTLNNLERIFPLISLDGKQVVLDIDIDVMFNIFNKLPYLCTEELIKKIDSIYDKAELIIICDSVESGHTPSAYKFIGDFIYDYFYENDVTSHRKKEKELLQRINNKEIDTALSLISNNEEQALLIVNSLIKISAEKRKSIAQNLKSNFLIALLLYDDDSAWDYLKKAYKVHKDIRFKEYYCEWLLKRNKLEDCEMIFNDLKELTTWRMLFYKGVCAYRRQNYKEARYYLEGAILKNPINKGIKQYYELAKRKDQV